jgi:hypothetical protein
MSGIKRMGWLFAPGIVRRFIVGIDQQGTSREALRFLFANCETLHVVHSTRPDVTFHPKAYLAEAGTLGLVFVGSSNMTAGGFFTNIESQIAIEHDLPAESVEFQRARSKLYEQLVAGSGEACLEITQHNIDPIAETLPSEISIALKIAASGAKEGSSTAPSLFGKGKFPHAPALEYGEQGEQDEQDDEPVVADGAIETLAGEAVDVGKGVIFWKRLSRFDVSASSAPGQMIIPIGFASLMPGLGATQLMPNGARQSESVFEADYVGPTGVVKRVTPRIILYEPAPNHPRPNRELRFTFHDRSINPGELTYGDVLVFERLQAPVNGAVMRIRRIPSASAEMTNYAGKFGLTAG